MKIFLASLLILALTVSGGIWADFYLNSVAEDVEKYCDKISQTQEESDEFYENTYNELNEYWQKKKKTLSVIIDHVHIGEVDKSLSEMEVSIDNREYKEMFLALARVKTVIETVAQNEHFHLNSIL